MKKIINIKSFLIVCAISLFSITAHGSNSLEELSEIRNIEYIYISESMLKSMGGNVPVDVLSAISNLTSIEILSSDEANAVKQIKKKVSKITQELEVISKMKEDDEQISFYGIKSGNFYSRMLLIIEEDGEICLIELTGKVNPEELKKLQDAL